MSRFIIVDDFNGSINLGIDEDGEVMVFTDKKEAENMAEEYQNGIVIELPD